MLAAVLKDGVVVNLIVVESIDGMQDVVDGEGAQIGDAWDGAVFVKPVAEPPPVQVPDSVTRRQGLLALLIDGKLDSVLALIAAIEDPLERARAQIELDNAAMFERRWPLVLWIGERLGLDLDALFIHAATL